MIEVVSVEKEKISIQKGSYTMVSYSRLRVVWGVCPENQ